MPMPIPRKPKYFQIFKIPGENIFIKSIQKFFTFIFANRGLFRDEIEGEKSLCQTMSLIEPSHTVRGLDHRRRKFLHQAEQEIDQRHLNAN